MRSKQAVVGLWAAACVAVSAAHAQGPPKLQAIYPAGGRVGSTVEVVLRGGVSGVEDVLVYGSGLKAEAKKGNTTVDNSGRQVFNAKCAGCHELRGPESRPYGPQQWEATVDRMIQKNGADIKPADRDKIVTWLKAVAANGQLTATMTIDKDARPGRRELRVVTAAGASNAYPFYIGEDAEELEFEPNDTPDQAREVKLPCVVNGTSGKNGDRDFFKFVGRKDQHVVFHALSYRLSEESQVSFNPCLFLTNSAGKQIARSYGGDALDPVLDVTLPADGDYRIELRDLLYRGGPAAVYRLEIGELGVKETLFPMGGKRGSDTALTVYSENLPPRTWQTKLPDDMTLGLQRFFTPYGQFLFHISDYPETNVMAGGSMRLVQAPCVVNGVVDKEGGFSRVMLNINEKQIQRMGRWGVIGPFPGGKGTGLDVVAPVEGDLIGGRGFLQNQAYQGKKDQVKWEIKDPGDDGNINFTNEEDAVWYTITSFLSDVERDTVLAVGSDDGCKVWYNNQLVHTYRGQRPAMRASDLVPIHVRKGANTVVFKVLNNQGASGFHCALGAWTLNAFAQRLQSPLHPKLRLGYGNKWLADSRPTDTGDARIDWTFEDAGHYGVQIEDADGGGGPKFAYRLEIGPLRPDFTLDAFPSAVNLPRGGRMPIAVKRTSMAGYYGDIAINCEGLPAGITCTPAVIAPDHDHNLLVLQAAPDAKPGDAQIRVVGSAPSMSGPVQVLARPLDHYKLQNDPIPVGRNSMAATILQSEAPVTIDAEPKQITATPGGSATIKIKVKRNAGYTGDVFVTVWGLPQNQKADGMTLNGSQSEAEIKLNFPGGFYIGASEEPTAYRFLAMGFVGGDGLTGGQMFCSEPIQVLPAKPGATATPPAGGRPTAPPPSGDAAAKALFERKCSTCHKLFDPSNTKKTPLNWAQTVERMIQQNNARISDAEKEQITKYLQALAK